MVRKFAQPQRTATPDVTLRRRAGASGGVAQTLRLWQVLQLLQRVVLNLADSLAGHSERPAHLFEGAGLVALQAVAHLDHLALALRQHLQRPAHVLAAP